VNGIYEGMHFVDHFIKAMADAIVLVALNVLRQCACEIRQNGNNYLRRIKVDIAFERGLLMKSHKLKRNQNYKRMCSANNIPMMAISELNI